METPYVLDMADREEILALILSRSALLFLPTSHSPLPFHSPPFALSYMALSLTQNTLCRSTRGTILYLPHSGTQSDGEATIQNISCCGRMNVMNCAPPNCLCLEVIHVILLTFHCHSLNPASKEWRGQSYKVSGMRTRNICQH